MIKSLWGQSGDKVFKEKIQPSSMLNTKESADRVKPETKAEIVGQTIKLTSSDDNSKVLKTEYSLDYSGPVCQDSFGAIKKSILPG